MSALEDARRLKALADKATPGPWVEPDGRGGGDNGPYLASAGVLHVGRFDYASNALADKRFVAAARNDLPAILDAYIKACEALEEMRTRDDRNGSLPPAYRAIVDAALSCSAPLPDK